MNEQEQDVITQTPEQPPKPQPALQSEEPDFILGAGILGTGQLPSDEELTREIFS